MDLFLFLQAGTYLELFFFLVLTCILSLILYIASYFSVLKVKDIEKYSTYECGFEPFEDARGMFDVKFYLVAILFVIFDLEVVYLFPWSVAFYSISSIGFFTMFFFIFLLILVFIYEWSLGVLDWS
jgi:NADH-quinone oxidoreductase subunit A